VRTVSGLFLPKIKKGATTHDEEEKAAGRQARRRKSAAYAARVEAFTKICYNFLKKF